MRHTGELMSEDGNDRLFSRALFLGAFTVGYNVVEGVVSMALGINDETLALFGFGVDSFIEVLSGIGICVMITRIRNRPRSDRTPLEVHALRITGSAFYLLAAGLAAATAINIIGGHTPDTTFWGVIIALASIAVMLWLMTAKKRTGKLLQSDAIIADANCTRMCVYMSVVLLLSSLIYEFTGFAFADSIGALGLAIFSVSEGRESFLKAAGKACSCTGNKCE